MSALRKKDEKKLLERFINLNSQFRQEKKFIVDFTLFILFAG